MTQALVALGGNLGPVEATFDRALSRLSAHSQVAVTARSSTYLTMPVGTSAGAEFRNAAVTLETDLSPLDLLDLLQATEHALGRTRSIHWGPRPIDLDLIAYGDVVLAHPRLRLPHPACWYRRFVLDPLVEIAPNAVHPEKQLTFAALRERLIPRPITMSFAGGASNERNELAAQLSQRFTPEQVRFVDWPETTTPTFIACLPSSGDADEVPTVPRLDLPDDAEPLEFLGYVLQSALDEPRREERIQNSESRRQK